MTACTDSLLDALMSGAADGIVLCDARLQPVRASESARTVLSEREGGLAQWATSSAAAACREAAALALDRGGVAAICFVSDGERWEVRAAPLSHAAARVCVQVRPAATVEREALLRAAHDLKAPLHAIGGFGALLGRGSLGPLATAQREAVETLVAETGRLRAALDDLLERVRTGDPELSGARSRATAVRHADLGQLAREAIGRFAGLAAARGVCLAADQAGEVERGSAVRAALAEEDARTIVENLIANALAATPEGGSMRVSAGDGVPGFVTVRVEDDGPGIPEALLERVFEPHFRLADRGAVGGSGLGLAIARELAVRAGGSLSAANRATGGAVFTLSVPCAGPERRCVVRVAPVTTHAALARAHAVLDATGPWSHVEWERGVLTVERPTDAADLTPLAAQVGLACWPAG